MQKCFVKRDNKFTISTKNAITTYEVLPAGVYSLKADPIIGFYLEIVNEFKIPKKIYGNTRSLAERILNTFHTRENSTGVLLAGEKGSGKTMLAKLLSAKGVEQQIPTILINSAFTGDSFNTFLASIEQECIIIFDEFEKVYNKDEQKELLTIMDGVYPSRKLFILTCNEVRAIDGHMKNRPGRLFYFIEFGGLSVEFIKEYCADKLQDNSKLDGILTVACLFRNFNFDMLQALVEEINRYGDNAMDAIKILNCKPFYNEKETFTIELHHKGLLVSSNNLSDKEIAINPVVDDFNVWFRVSDDADIDSESIRFAPSLLKSIKAASGQFVYVNEQEQAALVLTKKVTTSFDYQALL